MWIRHTFGYLIHLALALFHVIVLALCFRFFFISLLRQETLYLQLLFTPSVHSHQSLFPNVMIVNSHKKQARLRRGMTRHKRGKYALAAADFQYLIDHRGSNMPELPQVRHECIQTHIIYTVYCKWAKERGSSLFSNCEVTLAREIWHLPLDSSKISQILKRLSALYFPFSHNFHGILIHFSHSIPSYFCLPLLHLSCWRDRSKCSPK